MKKIPADLDQMDVVADEVHNLALEARNPAVEVLIAQVIEVETISAQIEEEQIAEVKMSVIKEIPVDPQFVMRVVVTKTELAEILMDAVQIAVETQLAVET